MYRNVDGVELSDLAHRVVDGFVDEQGYIRRRPGLESWHDYALGGNSPVSGLFWWSQQQAVVCVVGGLVYIITRPSGVITATLITASDTMRIGVPTIFATDGTYVFTASGGRLGYSNGTANLSYVDRVDSDCPTSVSHVAYLDTYILVNNVGTNQFFWSDVGDSLTWNALNFASASGDADPITALHVVDRQIFLFGPRSLEIWENDGTTPFIRVPGGYFPVGCDAPYSVVVRDNFIFWLNDRRHFVVYSNGSIVPISTPIDRELADMSLTSDGIGQSIEIDGRPFLVFNFPTANKTFVYDIQLKSWAEWGYYNASLGDYQRWLGYCNCYATAWGEQLIGLRNNSIICKLDNETYDDNGSDIRLLVRTGHIDHGTLKRKRGNQLLFRTKRGHAGTTRTPKMMLRYSDDGSNRWSNECHVNLGDQANTEIIVNVPARGVYRTRQYEVSVTDPVPVMLGAAEANVDIMVS
jgi:hypothetical protein